MEEMGGLGWGIPLKELKTMSKRWMILLCLGAGVGGCSDDDEGGDGDGGGGSGGGGSGTTTFYCQVEDMGEVIGCSEHTVPNAALDASREACMNDDSGVLVDECSTAGNIGKCALTAGLVIHYYSVNSDPADSEQMCEALGGTWTAA